MLLRVLPSSRAHTLSLTGNRVKTFDCPIYPPSPTYGRTRPGPQFPVVETLLRDAADELLAFAGFPVSLWKKIWSTNQL